MGNVVTGLQEQESTRLYDLMRCEATMTAKDEVARINTPAGARPTTNGWLSVPGFDDRPSFGRPFHLSHTIQIHRASVGQ